MSEIQARWYQQQAVESIFGYFQHANGNPAIALPTGTGKSIVIALFCKSVLQQYPRTRIMIATHVKELVDQNARSLQTLWPEAPIGIYAAGLKQRDTVMPITFASIASVHKKESQFGWIDLFIIDEAHLLSPHDGTMYQTVIAHLKTINPKLKVIGLTATPFRLGQGRITDGGLFTDLCYDMTGVDAFNRLIHEGFLSPPINQPTVTEYDTSGVSMVGGDYNLASLQKTVNKRTINEKVLYELCTKASDRRSWLIFASGIEHAEALAEILNTWNVPSAAVHSKLAPKLRDSRILAFKSGELRCVVNQNVLTTGFDHPPIDCIGVCRATASPGLWVQMLGRGTRPSPATGKRNCLVLDFAGNTRRLGPINDPYIPKKKGEAKGDAPVKICPNCNTYNHTSARVCILCGELFNFQPKLIAQASTDEILRSDLPIVETLNVKGITYNKHTKQHQLVSTMKVSYHCGVQRFDEYICLEHQGGAGHKARNWWRERYPYDQDPPATVSEALAYISTLKVPARVRVIVNRKYPEVIGYEYD